MRGGRWRRRGQGPWESKHIVMAYTMGGIVQDAGLTVDEFKKLL
jgi:hypothetical protein